MAIYINRDAPESGIASLLALQGTKGDTELVHMTKPEVKMMMDTGLMSMNNETGLPQFAGGKNILSSLLPMIAAIAFPPLFGPAIGMALGTGALASSAIATGLGTAAGGILSGEDPVDALTKGLLSGGMSYGAGSLFPETFGFDEAQIPSNAHTKGPLHDTNVGSFGGESVGPYSSAGMSRGIDNIPGSYDAAAGIDYSSIPSNVGSSDITTFPGSGGKFRSESSLTNRYPQRLSTPLEDIDFNKQMNDRILSRPGFSLTRDPLYSGPTPPTMPDILQASNEFGYLPSQKYGTYNAEEISNLPSSEMLHRAPADFNPDMLNYEYFTPSPPAPPAQGVSTGVEAGNQIVDNTMTGAVTETSWMDRFKDELPGSLGEAGDRLVDPRSGIFSKQAMATGIGQLGANLLVPDEPEQLPLPKGPDPYVLRDRDYVYNKKKKSPFEGLTSSQIAALYQSGGNDLRSYQQPSSGSGVFPLKAKSGGGIEDLIRASEQVGISETPFEGVITGNGHGMQDNVMMPILQEGGVAAVSPKEYVVPADVMSMIGNGNADNGAQAMDGFIADFRTAKYGRPTQPPEMNGRSALQSLMKT